MRGPNRENDVTPSLEEIQKGRDAFRRIGTYEKRWQRARRSFIYVSILGLLFLFSVHVMGGGWGVLILVALLWFAPVVFIGSLLKLTLTIDQKTIQDLRKKYGAEIDFSN